MDKPVSASILTVEEFFKLGYFKPASVQRDYLWDLDECTALFDDLERAFESQTPAEDARSSGAEQDDDPPEGIDSRPQDANDAPGYHLGAAVLGDAGTGVFYIFDGLQRTVSLTVLLCVLREVIAAPELRARLQNLIKAESQWRLELTGRDRTLAKEVQEEGKARELGRGRAAPRGQRIRRARLHFHHALEKCEPAWIEAFAVFVIERAFLVVTRSQSRALCRQVFVTANARGKPLEPLDLFKGQLLALAEEGENGETFTVQWQAISEICGNRFREFLRAFDFAERRDPQAADYLQKLGDHVERNFGAQNLLPYVERMRNFALAWRALMEVLHTRPETDHDFNIWKLRLIPWDEWRPLALAWIFDYRSKRERAGGRVRTNTHNAYLERFDLLHRACMAITLAQVSLVGREKIFGAAIGQWQNGKNPFRQGDLHFYTKTKTRIRDTLGTPLHGDDIRLSLLRWIEASFHDPVSYPRDLHAASVEHVLPRNPEPGSGWLKTFPDGNARYSACHALGNLAVADYGANEEMSNSDFDVKLPILKEQSAKYQTLGDIADKAQWGGAEIVARTFSMQQRVWQELGLLPPPDANAASETVTAP